MTTPTKSIDAELDDILRAHRFEVVEEINVYRATISEDIAVLDKIHGKAKDQIKALIRQELEAVRAEIPEKRDTDGYGVWKGYNQAIDQITEVITKRIEAL